MVIHADLRVNRALKLPLNEILKQSCLKCNLAFKNSPRMKFQNKLTRRFPKKKKPHVKIC